MIQLIQQRAHGGFAWEQQAIGCVAIKQGGQLLCKLIEHAEQINLVSLPGFTKSSTRDLAVKLVTTRLVAFAYRLDQLPTRLHHQQRCHAVEHGKGLLAHHAVKYRDAVIGVVGICA